MSDSGRQFGDCKHGNTHARRAESARGTSCSDCGRAGRYTESSSWSVTKQTSRMAGSWLTRILASFTLKKGVFCSSCLLVHAPTWKMASGSLRRGSRN